MIKRKNKQPVVIKMMKKDLLIQKENCTALVQLLSILHNNFDLSSIPKLKEQFENSVKFLDNTGIVFSRMAIADAIKIE